jgi:histidinol-phosphate aminotransferase
MWIVKVLNAKDYQQIKSAVKNIRQPRASGERFPPCGIILQEREAYNPLKIHRLVRPAVRALRAYEASEVPVKVKLDANESPYGFRLRNRAIATNRYPDPECTRLRRALARRLGVSMSNVMAGNGSDELISCLITTFGGPVMYPVPSFVMYGQIARALGAEVLEIPLEEDFDLDLGRCLKAMREENPRLIFISSPNNPTGNCFDAGKILKIIDSSRGIVVVDEAYQPFSGERGFSTFLKDYPNLVIMRTLSKIGLAALRVGYIAAGEEIIHEVNKVRLPFNLNALSQMQAEEALADRKGLRLSIRAIVEERKRLFEALESMEDVTPCPSEANFILFRTHDPGRVHAGLLRRGVLVKNADGMVKGCLRVTMGTKKENGIFLRALKETLREKNKARKKNTGN